MIVFKINGIDMPTPSIGGWNITYSDVDGEGSGRNAGGFTRRQRLRKKLTKIEVAYNFIDKNTASKIIMALDPEFIEVTFHDTRTNSIITKSFYVGDVSEGQYGYNVNGKYLLNALKFNMIEQ